MAQGTFIFPGRVLVGLSDLCLYRFGPSVTIVEVRTWRYRARGWSNVGGTGTDELRFRRLFDDHYRSIVAYFLRRIDPDDAHDAADDVFLVAWRRLEAVPLGDEALPWLYGIARNVTSNRRRSARRATHLRERLLGMGPPESPSVELQVVRRADDRKVLDAIATLRPQDQELLRLAAWEELPHAEIGAILGCSRKAVDARLHRVMRRLAKVLEPSGHISPAAEGEHARGKA